MGPLEGVRVLEIAGVGPAPFGAMLLADMGAEVLRVERPADRATDTVPEDVLNRGKRSLATDLKKPEAAETVLRLATRADVLIEGFRPGVAERLGIGPEECLRRNPRLVYARMTGWGQDGPLAHLAGHDINYLALAGVLGHLGRKDTPPAPPLNLVGDFGGGGMLLAFGVVCALFERARSSRGQVIDAAMLDGTALLSTHLHGMRAAGMWHDERESNLIDGGAPFYDTYETADGKFISLGAVEPKFYSGLIASLGLTDLPGRDPRHWPVIRKRLADLIRSRTRDEWSAELSHRDICLTPVLDCAEAPTHPHNIARGTFTEHAGVVQPTPAPRFSRTPGSISGVPPAPGRDTDAALRDWGFEQSEVDSLRAVGAVAGPQRTGQHK
ncbi:alpha-methylacyl-CoA racemase [Kibdelosporangium banguiense]|uniref:Alpha-methylacyl-CoA racemase n=1 Tax=Kibdelosporangium banguiense TaxID=1365924 RepID=A0ABS4TVS1_9PSEU|nr:alpha-methylacyl-CoA racemase [Kibdelosporangium banguiense]